MFKICLFDLDETLVRTDDLEDIRKSGVRNDAPEYVARLTSRLQSRADRHIYSIAILNKIRTTFPELKLGIFTRSPRSYAKTVLGWAYPGFHWDIVVAYEDVEHTKPHGDGIDDVMDHFDILHTDHLPAVILVGDSDVDVKSAYNCGCVVTLDKGAWERPWEWAQWQALNHVPDAIIEAPTTLLDVLSAPTAYLPELERRLIDNVPTTKPRFDDIGHFIPTSVGGDRSRHPIHVAGRSFAKYDCLTFRRGWHLLTESIEKNKNSINFPDAWIDTVRTFLEVKFPSPFGPVDIVISTVPHRPGRVARLESFLGQLEASLQNRPIPGRNVRCAPGLLAYKPGVKSNHGDYLGGDDRFINVRDHLYVQQRQWITPQTSFLLIDDVVTTGASLIYARKYLQEAGAGITRVKCLAMAKNISKLF